MTDQAQVGNVTNTTTASVDLFCIPILASISTSIAICGLIGHILGSVVLHRMQRTNKGLRLLKYLALLDIVVIVCVFFKSSLSQMNIGYDMLDTVHRVLDPFPYLLGMTFYMCEIYLTVLIAVQRSIALALPFQFERYMRDSVVNKILAATIIFTVAYNIPLWLKYCPRPYWNERLHMMLFETGKCDIIGLRTFLVYMGPVTLVFRCIIPLIILIVSNVILIISRRRMKKRVHRAEDRGADQLTMAILAITIMSVITHATTAAQLVLAANISTTAHPCLKHSAFTGLLFIINCSLNFIFYYSFGKEFRKGLTSLFRSNN